MSCTLYRNEMKRRHFLLDHHDPREFTVCQWSCPAWLYVAYRIVIAVFFLVWLVLSGVNNAATDGVKWFLYLTNWSFLILTLKTVIMVITATQAFVVARQGIHQEGGGMSWFLKMQWVIYNITVGSAIIVTINYWGFLWNPSKSIRAISFVTHGFNSIYVIADMFVTATPIHLLHIWIPMVYGVVYLTFTAIYFGAGGTDPHGKNYVYSVMDFYGNTKISLLVSLGVVFIVYPVVWLMCFGLVSLRRMLSRTCCPCGRDYTKHGHNTNTTNNEGSVQNQPSSSSISLHNEFPSGSHPLPVKTPEVSYINEGLKTERF